MFDRCCGQRIQRASYELGLGALPGSDATRYILLTECLQNDFFLNQECRRYLGDHAALSMLAAGTRRFRRAVAVG